MSQQTKIVNQDKERNKNIFLFMNDDKAYAARHADMAGGVRYTYNKSNAEGPEMLINGELGIYIHVFGGKSPDTMLYILANRLKAEPNIRCIVQIAGQGFGFNYVSAVFVSNEVDASRIIAIPGAQ